MRDKSSGPGLGSVVGAKQVQVSLLQGGPLRRNLPKKKVIPSNVILGLGGQVNYWRSKERRAEPCRGFD